MFTWICPQCGGEVLPSQDECPRCVKAAPPEPADAQTAAAMPAPQVQGYGPPAGGSPAAPAPVGSQPPVHVPFFAPSQPPQPRTAPVPPTPPVWTAPPAEGNAARAAAPTYTLPAERASTVFRDIIVTVGIAAVLLGIGYFVWNRGEAGEKKPQASKAALEDAKGGRAVNPLAKQIEVTGIRLRVPKPGQAEVQLLVVNHSAAEITDLSMDVILNTRGSSAEVAMFPVKVKRLAPLGSAEVLAKATPELKAIDIPDWQFLEAKVVIQSPAP